MSLVRLLAPQQLDISGMALMYGVGEIVNIGKQSAARMVLAGLAEVAEVPSTITAMLAREMLLRGEDSRGVGSTPPLGHHRVSNLYVDAITGRLVVQYEVPE